MSHKILLGAAFVAVAVLGFAWFTILPQQTSTPAVTTVETTQSTTTSTTSGTPSGTPTTPSGYTLATIATHNNASSCWAALNGKVYDLTSWINQHPGGPEHIL